MNRADAERAKQIINLWISYKDKKERDDSIAFEGSLDEGVGSSTTPNPTLAKAERLEGQEEITAEEKKAFALVEAYPYKLQLILTKYEVKRNATHSGTNRNWTHLNVAFSLQMKIERYTVLREHLINVLVTSDRTNEKPEVLAAELRRVNFG